MLKEVQKAAIKKIVLSVGGKEIVLSPSEAKELKSILMELFGEEKVVHEHHWYPKYWTSNAWPKDPLKPHWTSGYIDTNANTSSNDITFMTTTGSFGQLSPSDKDFETIYLSLADSNKNKES